MPVAWDICIKLPILDQSADSAILHGFFRISRATDNIFEIRKKSEISSKFTMFWYQYIQVLPGKKNGHRR